MKKIYENPQMKIMLVDTGDCMTASGGLGAQSDDVKSYAEIFGMDDGLSQ